LMMTEMFSVAPTIGKEIRGTDRQDDAFVFPGGRIWNFHEAAIPTNFIARCGAMVFPRDFEGITIDARGVIIIVARGITLTPGGQGFPAKWHNDLLAPFHCVGREPEFLQPASLAIKAKLPGAVEVEPVVSLNAAAPAVRPGIFGAWIKKLS